MLDAELEADILASLPPDLPPTVFISSLTNKNIQRLKDMIWGALHE
jgi:GTP-binding protein